MKPRRTIRAWAGYSIHDATLSSFPCSSRKKALDACLAWNASGDGAADWEPVRITIELPKPRKRYIRLADRIAR